MNKPIRREFLRRLVHTFWRALYTDRYLYNAETTKKKDVYTIYRTPIKKMMDGTIKISGKRECIGEWEYK